MLVQKRDASVSQGQLSKKQNKHVQYPLPNLSTNEY
jgi:hypothetical protein